MKWKLMGFGVAVCALSVAACSKTTSMPSSPTAVTPANADANPDGSTLKAVPPVPVSPGNGQTLELGATEGVTLVVNNSVSVFGVGLPASYRFQLLNEAGELIEDSSNVPAGATQTSYTLRGALEGDRRYTWRARAEVNNGQYVGSWSALSAFVSPQNVGYISGSELYDPLVNGRTVGAMSGPLTFIPGVGLRFESFHSFVAYVLPQTLNEGEFSLLITGMPANTDGDKTKVISMAQGLGGDVVTNERRMTVEKRGDPAGFVAWRFITHGDQVDTEGAEREYVDFQESGTYFMQATWRSNVFRVIIRSGGVDGPTIYNKGKGFEGRAYDPSPHVVYLGMPVGRSGPTGASVDQMTLRQVWVSGRPRPAFANR